MNTAVILGSGPEIGYFFSVPEEKRRHVLCFSTDASKGHPSEYRANLTVLNLLELEEAIEILRNRGVTKIVTIGSMNINGTFLNAKSKEARIRLIKIGFGFFAFGTTSFAESYFRELKDHFELLPAKSVLPFLFASDEVAINRANDIRDRALAQPVSEETDYELQVDGKKIKMFRVKAGDWINLVNRRLFLEKLRRSHSVGGITHFFFDIDRTIVVNLNELIGYAQEHKITLQSFREPD